jgi:GntR family transcriptional regulator
VTQILSRKLEPSAVVDGRLRTPLYHQIYLILRDKIRDEVYPDGAPLPSELQLMRQYGVSRITAKRALDELAADGLVVRARGRGTRVRFSPPAPPIRASVEGLLENLLTMGLKTEVVLLDFDYVPATPDVAAALECAPGKIVQRAVRIRTIKGEPFSHLTTHVPETIGRSYSRHDLASKPLLSLLERMGVEVSRAEQTISAKLADAQVATHLGVEVGSALLKISRVVRDQAGRPVEFITGLYRPDRYHYTMQLSRIHDQARNVWSAVDTKTQGRGPRRGRRSRQAATPGGVGFKLSREQPS